MKGGATVIKLGEWVRACGTRHSAIRLLAPYAWFRGARLEVKPTGRVVILAFMDAPRDPAARDGVLERVASHLGGVSLETRIGCPPPASRTREQRPTGCRGIDTVFE